MGPWLKLKPTPWLRGPGLTRFGSAPVQVHAQSANERRAEIAEAVAEAVAETVAETVVGAVAKAVADTEARLNAALEAKLIRQVGARLGLNSA